MLLRHRLCLLTFLCLPLSGWAWNSTGHRLVSLIAWSQLTPKAQEFVFQTLQQHPDYPEWSRHARNGTASDAANILAEASLWPDQIRNDPRFVDEEDPPLPPLPGFPSRARHRDWHYINVDAQGRVVSGGLRQQLPQLIHRLRHGRDSVQRSYDLPWLAHLVADLHQPLHVGHAEDVGGNDWGVEDPGNPRMPITNLHRYWDALPSMGTTRGQRLRARADALLDTVPAPPPNSLPEDWIRETRALLGEVYALPNGTLLPAISPEYEQKAVRLANRQLVKAGYRLAWLLESIADTQARQPKP